MLKEKLICDLCDIVSCYLENDIGDTLEDLLFGLGLAGIIKQSDKE